MEITLRVRRVIHEKGDFRLLECENISQDSSPTDIRGKTLPRGARLTCSGVLLPTGRGTQLTAAGSWQPARGKYGESFRIAAFKQLIEGTEEGIRRFLAGIRGIGEKKADLIVQHFGTAALDVLEEDPDSWLALPGVTPARLALIRRAYWAATGLKELMDLLQGIPISTERAIAIYETFGKASVRTVQERPYELCRVPGLSFETVDRIALGNGLEPDAPQRIQAGLLQGLLANESRGHTYMQAGLLVYDMQRLFSDTPIQRDWIWDNLRTLERDRKICLFPIAGEGSGLLVFRYQALKAEGEIAKTLIEKTGKKERANPNKVMAEIRRIESKSEFRLTEEQIQAVKMGVSSPVTVITGGPGVGKSTVINYIVQVYRKLNPKRSILLTAPTGKAARRMAEVTGLPALTLHAAMGLKAGEDEEPDRLTQDLVVVDEASMIDVYLMHHLTRALAADSQLIIIGDVDQLPSVGAGAVLTDLIDSGTLPVTRLTQTKRQSGMSRIPLNASILNNGSENLEYGPDFELLEMENSAVAQEQVITLFQQAVRTYGLENVCVLAPIRRSDAPLSVNTLNPLLRDAVNPLQKGAKELAPSSYKTFRDRDKVLQTRNLNGVANGDIGYITSIDPNLETVFIDFGQGTAVEYSKTELENLELAYALTIHKSQGSEYQCVIISLLDAPSSMMQKNLLYTAVTRAKQKVIIIGTEAKIREAVQNTQDQSRRTSLKYWLVTVREQRQAA